MVVLEDYSDFSPEEAEKILKNQKLSAKIIGAGERVTAQIPAAGEVVPGGSQVLLYLGEVPDGVTVKVPDFTGMNRQQASDAAGALGIYILVTGNREIAPKVTVTAQSVPAGAEVPAGATVELQFSDTTLTAP
jgi:stage V sporulation protein D (sporulation-specific penicillin-binding protein)